MRISCAAIALALVAATVPLCPAAGAGEPGRAEGTLTLDRASVALTHVYAREILEIPEMRYPDWPARTITVILTDRPMPQNHRVSYTLAVELSFAGQMRGLMLEIDPATRTVRSGRTLVPDAERPQFFTVIGDPPMVALEGFAEDGAAGIVTARAWTRQPMEVVSFDDQPGPKSFTFDVSFTARIMPAPKLLETLEGEAAKASAPGQALKRFLEAVAAADPAAIRAAVISDHPALAMLDPGGLAQLKEMVLTGGASPDAAYGRLAKVYVYENGATVLLKEAEGWSSYLVAREDGTWKLGGP
ncbi:MAG: hypothetical protein ACOY3L_18030 [Pseudomonadota bacterium]